MSRLGKSIVSFFLVLFTLLIPLVTAASPQSRRRTGQLLARIQPKPAATIKLSVPFHRQEHALSCEVASLRSALLAKGVEVTEETLFAELAKDHTQRTATTWGDPTQGFVGSVDGSQSALTGYGVYAEPLGRLATNYRSESQVVVRGFSTQELAQEIADGNPVIIWGITGRVKDISWLTPEGVHIPAFVGEHSRVVSGFAGSAEEPVGFFLVDPVYGELYYSSQKLLDQWVYFDQQAVIIR